MAGITDVRKDACPAKVCYLLICTSRHRKGNCGTVLVRGDGVSAISHRGLRPIRGLPGSRRGRSVCSSWSTGNSRRSDRDKRLRSLVCLPSPVVGAGNEQPAASIAHPLACSLGGWIAAGPATAEKDSTLTGRDRPAGSMDRRSDIGLDVRGGTPAWNCLRHSGGRLVAIATVDHLLYKLPNLFHVGRLLIGLRRGRYPSSAAEESPTTMVSPTARLSMGDRPNQPARSQTALALSVAPANGVGQNAEDRRNRWTPMSPYRPATLSPAATDHLDALCCGRPGDCPTHGRTSELRYDDQELYRPAVAGWGFGCRCSTQSTRSLARFTGRLVKFGGSGVPLSQVATGCAHSPDDRTSSMLDTAIPHWMPVSRRPREIVPMDRDDPRRAVFNSIFQASDRGGGARQSRGVRWKPAPLLAGSRHGYTAHGRGRIGPPRFLRYPT